MKTKKTEKPIEESPLEAYKAVHLAIAGAEDFLVRACDGENEYIYLAVRKPKVFHVTEIYPGMLKKKTLLREVEDASDLKLAGKFVTVQDVIDTVNACVFADFEQDDAPEAEAKKPEAAAPQIVH